MPTLQNYLMSTEVAEQCSPYNLGLLLVFHLQSLQHIDQLLHNLKPGTVCLIVQIKSSCI